MVAHHTITGCNLRAGDMFGSGTISGATRESLGSLLEMTGGGKNPVDIGNGEERKFLEDGDELVLRGWAGPEGARVGFGECRGTVVPAVKM
jgi:fumarylacetoacetase